MVKFELIPNEIIIECCEYLTVFHIFHSFDRLNYRFSKLIRTIPFYLNFENICKTKFRYLCTNMRFRHPDIKQHIYSLYLSNRGTCRQIKMFLTVFPIHEFPRLQSLTLTQIEEENIPQLKSIPPLSSFHLISPEINDDEILSTLSFSILRKLSILTLRYFLIHIQQPTRLTHLTIHSCSLEQLLYQLFQYVPLLKYLNIEYISEYNRLITTRKQSNAIHLKQLIIGEFKYSFEGFVVLAQQIPNLQYLTISAYDDISMSMMHANRWEDLITTSLPYLKTFKFNFSFEDPNLNFQQFQSDFWIQQHQWYTEVLYDKYSSHIYTIPYLSNTLELEADFHRLCFKKSDVFQQVTNLTLDDECIETECSFLFSNVISLQLITSTQSSSIESLKEIMNFSNLKHLDISMYQKLIRSEEFFGLIKQLPQLSSITICPKDLIVLFNNQDLCEYLNKIIKKFNLYKHGESSFSNTDELKTFCQIFSNLEQFRCGINQFQQVLFLIYRLPNISTMYIHLSEISTRTDLHSLFNKALRIFKFSITRKGFSNSASEIVIWMDKMSMKQISCR